jgi:hypothetical protein
MRNKEPKRQASSQAHSAFRAPHSEILLGAHMSIGGGAHRAIERGRSIDCTAMQIFVKNNMQWFARPLLREEISAFLDHARRQELQVAFAHANYLINLAATNPQFLANSIRALSEELVRADQLDRSGFRWTAENQNADRARDNGRPGIVSRRSLRTSRRHHRQRARTGAALRLSRYRPRLRGGL